MITKLTTTQLLKIFINETLPTFGLSNSFTPKQICQLVNDGIFSTNTKFKKFIDKEFKQSFWLPPTHIFFKTNNYEETLKALFARTLVVAANNILEFENNIYKIKPRYNFKTNAVFRAVNLYDSFSLFLNNQKQQEFYDQNNSFDFDIAMLELQKVNILSCFGIETSCETFENKNNFISFLKPYQIILEEFDIYNEDTTRFLNRQNIVDETSCHMFFKNTLAMNLVNISGNLISKDSFVCGFKQQLHNHNAIKNKTIIKPFISFTFTEQCLSGNSFVTMSSLLNEGLISKAQTSVDLTKNHSIFVNPHITDKNGKTFFSIDYLPSFPPWFFLCNVFQQIISNSSFSDVWETTGILFNFEQEGPILNRPLMTLTAIAQVQFKFKQLKKIIAENLDYTTPQGVKVIYDGFVGMYVEDFSKQKRFIPKDKLWVSEKNLQCLPFELDGGMLQIFNHPLNKPTKHKIYK